MNQPITERTEHLFIVRVWQEPTQTAPAHWRGSIEHVPSAQRVYFESLQDLSDFIALRVSPHEIQVSSTPIQRTEES